MNFLVACLMISVSFTLSAQHNHGVPKKEFVKKAATSSKSKADDPRVTVDVPLEQQKRIGLKTTKVEKKSLVYTIRTVGSVTADQRLEAHIHSKINGWIEQIYADYIGMWVKKGESLFDLYSPEIVTTQEEYISAIKQPGVGKELAKAALDRLKLWGVPQSELDKLTKRKKASRTIRFESPVNGFIIKKNAIQGMYITPGMELYQIADLSRVWIMTTLYEYDVSVVSEGDEAEVQLHYGSNRILKAPITYISPEIDIDTRTAKARIEVSNKDLKLKPGMYANIQLKKDLGESLVIPEDALIDTGLRKIVFVKISPSKFEPRTLKIGPRVNGYFAVLDGLKIGEEIVSGAHFFIDAESKLKAAFESGASGAETHQHSGH